MSDPIEQFEGGCLCGAVRFVATGQPKGVYWCHCQSCRKHSGAPVSVFVAFEHTKYTVSTGEIPSLILRLEERREAFAPDVGQH
jgi:hypothetical protein